MLTLEEMLFRLLAAMAIGAFLGWERELMGKEAGIRTSMLVAGGAAIFAIIGVTLPFIGIEAGLNDISTGANGALTTVANIVVGVGFLGAGIIFRDKERVHGLTTAAVVWATAALGALAGIGLWQFAAVAGFTITVLLFLLRKVGINNHIEHD